MILQQLFLFATADPRCEKDFFGLVPWYHYLDLSKFNSYPDCSIKSFKFLGSSSDMPLILLAVVDDLLRIAGIVAVGFVIYGAFQFIASQGNPEGTAKAQTTVINALLGLAVAIAAITFVSFLGDKLGG
jgi:hypothetical protein